MKNQIRTAFMRLDKPTDSLTKNALAQLLLKALYQETAMTLTELSKKIDAMLSTHISQKQIDDVLDYLTVNDEVQKDKRKYCLKKKTLKRIQDASSETERLFNTVINEFFKDFYTESNKIEDWLTETTLAIFSEHASDWVSDISYKTNRIHKSKKNIEEIITTITNESTDIDTRDKKGLQERFIEFVFSKGYTVDAFLWHFGMAAFSAKLVTASKGIDSFTKDVFNGATCILDTNVLMNFDMDASEFFDVLESLEDVFIKLDIKPGYLKITSDEFIRTLDRKKADVLRTVEKYSMEVLKGADDIFIKSGLKRNCVTKDDFERFFSSISNPPNRVYENLSIILIDHDQELEDCIIESQTDSEKKDKINSLFKSVTKHDKKPKALEHDVGLIYGVEYLRKKKKVFTISQETSVNEYSHSVPFIEHLPFAIRLETLINILAVENGGCDIDPVQFKKLFSTIIKQDLYPEKDTYKVTDLSRMLDIEMSIEQFPVSKIKQIAIKTHKNYCNGLSEEQIALELCRDIQGAKIEIVDELTETKLKLQGETENRNREEKKNIAATSALRQEYMKTCVKEYDKQRFNDKLIGYLAFPLLLTALIFIGFLYGMQYQFKDVSLYIFTIVPSLIINLITGIKITKPFLSKRSAYYKLVMEKKVDEMVKQAIG
jgi:hypothetical protein